MTPPLKKCPGSGTEQMIAWPPGETYPGAVVCSSCSHGVAVVKGSVHSATSVSGHEGTAGKVRVHYVAAGRFRYHTKPVV